ALTGLRVADILPPTPPRTVSGWLTVQAFLDDEVRGAARADGAGAEGTGAQSPGPGMANSGATAFPVRDFDGHTTGLLTLSQLAVVPAPRRDAVRIADVATPVSHVVTTTLDEPLGRLVSRLARRPTIPAALHTAGHALVLGDDGAAAGVLTPADFARASHLGALNAGSPT
ncbi:MAG TPA: hypothetical protein VIV12_16590, partial [Streptosporangiaceae bacterium]